MYIRKSKEEKSEDSIIRKNNDENEKKESFFQAIGGVKRIESSNEDKYEKLEAPRDMLIESHSEDVFLSWQAPEFEMFERDKKWYLIVLGMLLLIIGYALFTNSIVMAILFILIGVVGYIYINKEPRILTFMITKKGLVVEREIYEFDSLKSFWIFYEVDNIRVISLHTEGYLAPYIHIPIHDEDPVMIRKILLDYIPEEKHEPGIAETLDRLLHL